MSGYQTAIAYKPAPSVLHKPQTIKVERENVKRVQMVYRYSNKFQNGRQDACFGSSCWCGSAFELVFVWSEAGVAGRWSVAGVVQAGVVRARVVQSSCVGSCLWWFRLLGVDVDEVLPFPLGAKSRGLCAEDQLCRAVGRRVPERAHRPPRHLEGAGNQRRSRGAHSVSQAPRT